MVYIKKMGKYFYLLFFLLIVNSSLIAQDSASIYHLSANYFVFDKAEKNAFNAKDTTQNQLPNYFIRNRMGALGFPDYPLLLSYKEYDLGSHWFRSGYDHSMFGLDNKQYYSTKKVNTSVFAAAGSKKEQFLKLTHFQNINEHLNFSFKLNRLTADNFYQNQRAFTNNVLFSSNYLNPKKRIGFQANISFDRFKHNENGGVSADSSIIQDVFVNKILVPVQLINAKRDFRMLAGETKLLLRLTKDTTNFNGHYIEMGAKASVLKSEYFDTPSSGFYDTTYINGSVTHDSTGFSKISPLIGYLVKKNHVSFGLATTYNSSKINVNSSNRIDYSSLIVSQHFAVNLTSLTTRIKQDADYVSNGFNSGNYKVNLASNTQLPLFQSVFGFRFLVEKRNPDLFWNHLKSNHYEWTNDFKPIHTNMVEFNWSAKKLNLTLGALALIQQNMIYLGNFGLPQQLNKSSSAVRYHLNHKLKIFRFNLNNHINYQTRSTYAWALPKLFTQHQFYYEHPVKKNGMIFQIGVQGDYIHDLELISYSPALNSYYIQSDSKSVHATYFIDFFITMRFKDFNCFFKTEHVNQGLNTHQLNLMNGYYQRDRSFRFGLRWDFHD